MSHDQIRLNAGSHNMFLAFECTEGRILLGSKHETHLVLAGSQGVLGRCALGAGGRLRL